jgi:hypothetical protein
MELSLAYLKDKNLVEEGLLRVIALAKEIEEYLWNGR